jgi:hypothetical protein
MKLVLEREKEFDLVRKFKRIKLQQLTILNGLVPPDTVDYNDVQIIRQHLQPDFPTKGIKFCLSRMDLFNRYCNI